LSPLALAVLASSARLYFLLYPFVPFTPVYPNSILFHFVLLAALS
jgi:hypothetical protein